MTATAESSTSRQQRQPLPLHWVERIFQRMAVLYGNLFFDRWRDIDADALKDAWAEELAGFRDRPDCIKHALDCLRERPLPPTLPEFLADCRRAPAPTVRAIEHRVSPEEAERNRARLAAMAEKLGRRMSA